MKLRLRVQCTHNRLNFRRLSLRDQVDLAQHNYVCELDLVHEQVRDGPLVTFTR